MLKEGIAGNITELYSNVMAEKGLLAPTPKPARAKPATQTKTKEPPQKTHENEILQRPPLQRNQEWY